MTCDWGGIDSGDALDDWTNIREAHENAVELR